MMNQLYQFFYNQQKLLPYITIFLVVLGVIVLLGILILVYVFVRKSTRKKPPPKPEPLSKTTAEAAPVKKSLFAVEEESIFYRHSWSAKWLSRLGFYPRGKTASSFLKAMQLLRDQVGGNQYLYKLPWFLMVGPSNGGKSTLLKYVGLPEPVGKPTFYAKGEKPGCDWSFFEHSVVLDVRGDYLLGEKDAESEGDMWSHLITLLNRFRPKRPLDGVILAIPSTELVGDTKLDANMLAARAEHVQQKLALLSARTGMRIPVYVVITKADHIPGFKSFANEIPRELDQDIFGWSCPYPVEESYAPTWIEDAYGEIQDNLETLQNEIFSHGDVQDEADGVFLFPSMLQKTKDALRIYTDNIFKGTGYQNFYFLRGIYFCGDADMDYSADKVAGLSVDFGSVIPRLGEGQALVGEAYKRQPDILFTRRLLGDKIFQEYGLARPDARRLHTANRQIHLLQLSLVGTIIIGLVGINRAHERIENLASEIVPMAFGVEGGLKRLDSYDTSGSTIIPTFFEEQAKLTLSMVELLKKSSLRSVFMPASWFRGLESKSDALIQYAYDHVILEALRLQLNARIDRVISAPISLDYKEEPGIYTPPVKTVEFVKLTKYVQDLVALERSVSQFNQLKTSRSLTDLADVIEVAFGYSMGSSFKANALVHREALARSTYRTLEIFSENAAGYSPKKAAQEKLLVLFDDFTKRVFNKDATFKGIQTLEGMIDTFVDSRYKNLPTLSALQSIAQGVKSTVSLIETPGLNWLDSASFSPQTYQDLLATIESSSIFGTDFVAKLNARTDKRFVQLKEDLKQFDSPLTGKLFAMKGNQLLSEPSEGLKKLNELLGEFVGQSFMGQVKHYEFSQKIPQGRMLFWNKKGIERAIVLTGDFIKYSAERLPLYPDNLQEILKLMAREQLRESVMSLVGMSQSFVDKPMGNNRFVNEEVMRTQTRNLQSVTSQFIELLRALEKAGNVNAYLSIRDILLNQTFNVLEVADNVLESENLYAFKDGNFDWWQGQTQAANLAFDVNDKDAMRNYLDSQRDRVLYLADTFVRPLLALYGNDVFKMGSVNAPLLDKWIRLLEQSNAYQDKKPNTSISKAEKFFADKMNLIGWNNCLVELTGDVVKADGDFFIHKMNRAKGAMLDRCRVILGEKIYDQYTQLHTFFETNLAGRFPFVADPQAFSYGEASLRDVKAFFQLFDQYRDSTREVLEQSTAFGAEGQNVLRFIQDMTAVESFLKPFLVAGDEKKPGFDFDVEFRINRDAEFGGNRIIDWTLFSGSQAINFRDDKKQGRWEFGVPVAIQLRWAQHSPEMPVSDPSQKALNVAGNVATFGYGGQWGLLRLFMNHATSSADLVVSNDTRPEILTLNVPVRPQGQNLACTDPEALTRYSKVFVRVMPVIKSTENQTTPVTVPYFPAHAPVLTKPENPVQVYFSDLLTDGTLRDAGVVGVGKVGDPVPLIQEDSFQEAVEQGKKEEENDKEPPAVQPKKGKKK